MKSVRLLSVLVLLTSACIAPEDEEFESDTNATTPSGVVGAVLSQASLTDVSIDIDWENFEYQIDGRRGRKVYMTMQSVTFAAGGHTGWHTHAGPTVALITSGTLTVYRERDLRDCDGRVFDAGSAFMDGPDFGKHIARNETADTTVVHLLHNLPTATTPFRIDVPAPPGAAACGL
jgi:hypothetical protein